MSADMAQLITVEDCSVQSISPTKPKTQNSNGPPLVLNILYTQYEIIHEVAQECNFWTAVDDGEEDWDVWFIDGPVIPTLLMKMKPY